MSSEQPPGTDIWLKNNETEASAIRPPQKDLPCWPWDKTLLAALRAGESKTSKMKWAFYLCSLRAKLIKIHFTAQKKSSYSELFHTAFGKTAGSQSDGELAWQCSVWASIQTGIMCKLLCGSLIKESHGDDVCMLVRESSYLPGKMFTMRNDII